ncbi:MAG: 3D domain-containing protein [Verrucomicrobiaceae bacterium]|nr:3D domain-containing protein [Verrucomicrobiaceae bacterium]
MITNTLVCVVALCAQSITGQLQKSVATAAPAKKAPVAQVAAAKPGQVISGVRTTAYTHSEADHLQYGAQSAVGTRLNSGKIRSAAADWSIYPLGTVFQIKGDSSVYVVDDYGSALVGTRTIDIYQPSTRLMNRWGTRRVDIHILRWGSMSKSLAVLKPRAGKASHVREMIYRIQTQQRASS